MCITKKKKDYAKKMNWF